MLQSRFQSIRRFSSLSWQLFQSLLRFLNGLLGHVDQFLVGILPGCFGFIAVFPQGFANSPGEPLGLVGKVCGLFLDGLPTFSQHLLGSPNRAFQNPHAVRQLPAIQRPVNVGLHHRPSRAQLATLGHLELSSQLRDALIERLQRLRLDQSGAFDQHRVIRDALEIHPAELAQDQAVADLLFSLFVAVPIQSANH
jgi:hypothetical protein